MRSRREGPLHANFRLSATGGTVWLFDAAGLALDSLTYPALGRNVSYGRDPDGGASLASFIYPTPGAANRARRRRDRGERVQRHGPEPAARRAAARTRSGDASSATAETGSSWSSSRTTWIFAASRCSSATTPARSRRRSRSPAQPLLSDLRSGTIITVSADLATDVSYDPAAGDWWINLRAAARCDGVYISNANFSVSQNNTQITILDAAGGGRVRPGRRGDQPGQRRRATTRFGSSRRPRVRRPRPSPSTTTARRARSAPRICGAAARGCRI